MEKLSVEIVGELADGAVLIALRGLNGKPSKTATGINCPSCDRTNFKSQAGLDLHVTRKHGKKPAAKK